MDCTKMSDADLMAAYSDCNAELSRRAALASIPGQIQAMTVEYVAGGGDRGDLARAVANAPDPDPETT